MMAQQILFLQTQKLNLMEAGSALAQGVPRRYVCTAGHGRAGFWRAAMRTKGRWLGGCIAVDACFFASGWIRRPGRESTADPAVDTGSEVRLHSIVGNEISRGLCDGTQVMVEAGYTVMRGSD
ncbi:MAG: hypothetical protein ACLR23_06125 [Clostridia bacterium]